LNITKAEDTHFFNNIQKKENEYYAVYGNK
jgi:hypothetical protein